MRRPGHRQPGRADRDQVRRPPQQRPRRRAEHQVAQDHHALVQRRPLHDHPDDVRVDRQRIERAGEQEQRHRDQHHVLEVLPGLHVGGQGHPGGGGGEGDQGGARQREHRPRGGDQPHRRHHDQERHRVEDAAHHGPADLGQRHVLRAERGGQHRVVELLELEPAVDVERRVVQRAVQRRDRQQPGRDELPVRHRVPGRALHRADQAADADADREQVEQRLGGPGRDHQPHPPVEARVPLDQPQAPRAGQRGKVKGIRGRTDRWLDRHGRRLPRVRGG